MVTMSGKHGLVFLVLVSLKYTYITTRPTISHNHPCPSKSPHTTATPTKRVIQSMDLPVVSLDAFLSDPFSAEGKEEAKKTAESLILSGAVIVKDSRAPKEANDRFIDLFEDYFAQDAEVLRKDERPEWGYQVVCPPSCFNWASSHRIRWTNLV